MEDFLLAVDIGTTNVKGALFRVDEGKAIETFSQRITTYSDERTGAAEQDPEEIYRAFEKVLGYFAGKGYSKKIGAIFLSSQMHAFGTLSMEGRPSTRLLTYFDTRSREVLPLLNRVGYDLYLETGCPPLHVYPLAKIILARSKGWLSRADKVLLSAKDYIILKATGAHVLDLSTASGSQMLNVRTRRWSNLALELGGVDESQLPDLVEGSEKPLEISPALAKKVGLPEDTEVYAGASDASANQFGVGATKPDIVAINLGTSAAVRFLTDKPVFDDERMRFFLYYAGSGKYLAGGAVNNGGIVVEWFFRSLGRLESEFSAVSGLDAYTLIDSLASPSPPASNGLIALPFLHGGERFPIRNPDAKCIIYGLQFHHRRSDILRALLEGVAYTLKMIYDALCEHGLNARLAKIGGGASSLTVWRQIIADVFQMPVYRVKSVESTLLGSLIHYTNARGALREFALPEDVTQPIEENRETYANAYARYLKLIEKLSEFV